MPQTMVRTLGTNLHSHALLLSQTRHWRNLHCTEMFPFLLYFYWLLPLMLHLVWFFSVQWIWNLLFQKLCRCLLSGNSILILITILSETRMDLLHGTLIVHPRHPGMHISIDSQLLILSFEHNFFVCRHVSMWGFQNRVCPYPKKINHPDFVNISPTLVIDTSMEGLHEYYNMETQ